MSGYDGWGDYGSDEDSIQIPCKFCDYVAEVGWKKGHKFGDERGQAEGMLNRHMVDVHDN